MRVSAALKIRDPAETIPRDQLEQLQLKRLRATVARVFTTLIKQALPLIRYRTGDYGSLLEQPCECGRTTVRLTGLRGRRDDMLIVRGVNVHPS